MSGLFATNARSNYSAPTRAAGINLTTSVYGKPIALVYGMTRVAANLLLYGNFVATSQSSGGGSGGKGGLFSTSGGTTSYTYSATIAFALCEGPITGIGTVWLDNNLYTLASFTDTLFTGTFPQTPWNEAISWSYDDANGNLVSGAVTTELGYNGIAYVAFPNFQLGSSPNVPNLQFEVQGLLANSGITLPGDADPSQILTDVLTNANHGIGFPSAKLGSLTIYQSYCFATGLVVSPIYDTQRTGADIIDELALATNSAPVWTSGKFTLVPYGDTAVTGNGYTYTPPASVYSLTDADFIKNPQGSPASGGAVAPVVLERIRGSDKTNSVQIEFLDRLNNYAPSIAYANDQGLIDRFGLRSNGSRQMHLFCLSSAANLSAHLQLRRLARISNYFYFDLDQRYILLDPMDIISITDSNLGLSNFLVRVLQIQENDDGTLSFMCEEYLGTQGQPAFNFGTGAGYNANPNTAAQSVNVPIIFEPPSALLGGQGTNPEVWVAACGGSTTATDLNWGGANVWLATPPSSAATFQMVGTITNPARMGFVTAPLQSHAGSNPDSTGILTVDLTESGGLLASGSAADAQVANTICLVSGELVSYTLATLVGGNVYNLTGLYRGLYGTSNVSHNAGEQFARLDNSIFKLQLNATYVNQPLLVKLQSINTVGRGVQPLSSAAEYEYVPAGTALLHPLGQTLNIGNVDSGVLTSANAAVFEDYGYIGSQVPGGTLYHMPIGTDLGALGGSFSIRLSTGTGDVLVSGNRVEVAAIASFSVASSNFSGKGTWATWFNRTISSDNLPEMIMGQSDFSTTTSTALGSAGNLFVGISTANQLTVVGVLSNYNSNLIGGIAFVSTVISMTSTGTITSSGWHQMTLKINVSTAAAGSLVLYLDDSSVASQTISSGMEFPGDNFGAYTQRIVGVSTTSTYARPLPSGFNNFGGYLAETYFIDGQALTSTSFVSTASGVINFSTFVGLADMYLNYGNPNGVGLDLSGENNFVLASTLITSTYITMQHP